MSTSRLLRYLMRRPPTPRAWVVPPDRWAPPPDWVMYHCGAPPLRRRRDGGGWAAHDDLLHREVCAEVDRELCACARAPQPPDEEDRAVSKDQEHIPLRVTAATRAALELPDRATPEELAALLAALRVRDEADFAAGKWATIQSLEGQLLAHPRGAGLLKAGDAKPPLPEGWDPSVPPIDIKIPRIVCRRHGEVFRAAWPKGWIVFTLSIVQGLLGRDDFAAECGGELTAPRIEAALDAKPACERVTAAELGRLYLACGVGVRGVCVNCKRPSVGTPFQVSVTPGGPVKTLSHVCFVCVLYRMQAVN